MWQVIYQILLSLNVIVAVLRLLPYLSVSRPFGVLVITVEEMVSDLMQFLQLFVVVVIGFSLACTGLAEGDIKVFSDGDWIPPTADAPLDGTPLSSVPLSSVPLSDKPLRRRALKGGVRRPRAVQSSRACRHKIVHEPCDTYNPRPAIHDVTAHAWRAQAGWISTTATLGQVAGRARAPRSCCRSGRSSARSTSK